MWLFKKAPKAKIEAKYGFELTDPWLNHVRFGIGSVQQRRFGIACFGR